MKNILFISNQSNKINMFALASISAARNLDCNYHHVSNWSRVPEDALRAEEETHGIKIHNVAISRSPFSRSNIKAYRQLVDIIRTESIDYIHCNTPTGGLLGRLAGKKCGVKKVIYQAHGFHFYQGAPLLNWLVCYPIERWLARYTDALITINREDYALARKRMRLRGKGKAFYVPGVGIDTEAFSTDETVRRRKRQELNLCDTDIMLVSAGELNRNKNTAVILSALAKIKAPGIHYFICGVGDLEPALREQAEQAGLGTQVHFLGFRQDLKELLQAADVFLMASYREGLSRVISEAMACGLPCVVSKIRGNVDLIEEGRGGFLRAPGDVDGFAQAITALAQSREARAQMGSHNLRRVRDFDFAVVEKAMTEIYSEVFREVEE